MSNKIDARGLSCPQPVILTNRKIKEMGKGVLDPRGYGYFERKISVPQLQSGSLKMLNRTGPDTASVFQRIDSCHRWDF